MQHIGKILEQLRRKKERQYAAYEETVDHIVLLENQQRAAEIEEAPKNTKGASKD